MFGYELGEGIEKRQENFAEEVMSQVKKLMANARDGEHTGSVPPFYITGKSKLSAFMLAYNSEEMHLS